MTTHAERLSRLTAERLYLVSDDRLEIDDLLKRLELALRAGVRVVQFRDKRVERGELLRRAARVQELCVRHGALFIMNDAADVARLLDADGLHVGQDDLPPAAARALIGPDALLGLSVSYLPEAERALADGVVDYLGVGAMYETPTKPTAEYGGLALMSAVRAAVPFPLVGIGGIDGARAPAVFARGADLVAVVSAILSAPDSGEAARMLLNIAREAARRA